MGNLRSNEQEDGERKDRASFVCLLDRVSIRSTTKRRIVFYGSLVTAIAIASAIAYAVWMPARSFRDPPPPLDAREARYAAWARRDVEKLAGEVGERNTEHPSRLRAAADYVASELEAAGYAPKRHPYAAFDLTCETIDVDVVGTVAPREVVVSGAHFDSAVGAPGADDNASGVAGVLALARALAAHPGRRTIRFALFPNEEPPYFAAEGMGSLAYARELRARGDDVVALMSLENYHHEGDVPSTLDYPRLGRVVAGVEDVVRALATR
jgi:hypothetical protein